MHRHVDLKHLNLWNIECAIHLHKPKRCIVNHQTSIKKANTIATYTHGHI